MAWERRHWSDWGAGVIFERMNNATNSFINTVHQVLDYPLFTLGERSLTVALLSKLLLLLALVLAAEYVLRRFFTKRLLKRTRLDASLQYAIARIGGYLFILLGLPAARLERVGGGGVAR